MCEEANGGGFQAASQRQTHSCRPVGAERLIHGAALPPNVLMIFPPWARRCLAPHCSICTS